MEEQEQITLTYVHDGMEYDISETEFVHNKLQTDHDFASDYFRDLQLQENYIDVPDYSSGTFWNYDTTTLLLKEYKKRLNKFRDPTIKKRILWRQIALAFKSHNINISYLHLDRKFRNLKYSYRNLKNTRWPYSEIMKEILGNDEMKKDKNSSISKYAMDPLSLSSPERRTEDNYYNSPTKQKKEINNDDRSTTNDDDCDIKHRQWDKHLELEEERNNILRQIAKNTANNSNLLNRVNTCENAVDSLVEVIKENNEIMKRRNDVFRDVLNKLEKLTK